jgi:hypothetical protein
MGYAFAMSPCLGCKRLFSYNPMKVPSHRDAQGVKQPICQGCMTLINALRKDKGFEPFPIPPDAYEPCPEEELV